MFIPLSIYPSFLLLPSRFPPLKEKKKGEGEEKGRGYIDGGMNTLNNPEQQAPSNKDTLAENKGVTNV